MNRGNRGLTVGRGIALVAGLVALGVLVWDVAGTPQNGGFVTLGMLWHGAAPESLNLTQAVIQRYVHPALWDEAMVPLLLSPAAVVFAAIAVIALLPSLWRRLRRHT